MRNHSVLYRLMMIVKGIDKKEIFDYGITNIYHTE